MGWLRWLLAKIFHDASREIFVYWDGSRLRGIDPMLALRALHSHEIYNPETHPILAEQDDGAMQIMVQAGRDVFGLKPYEYRKGGLTETETVSLMVRFTLYLTELKKSTNPSPTSPASTEPPPSDQSATNAGSDSGSTSVAPKPAEPTAS